MEFDNKKVLKTFSFNPQTFYRGEGGPIVKIIMK